MNLLKLYSNNFPNQVKEVMDKNILRMISTKIKENKDLNYISELIIVNLLYYDKHYGQSTMINI
jgi:hypothetical protein